MKNHKKPKKFDYNVVVIGAGSAGLVSSLIAATLRARVALIEKHKMGGDCLNTGCVPSKALIRSAKAINQIKNHKKYGLSSASCDFDFSEIMERIQTIIKKIEPHDSVERFTGLGVECHTGEAKILSPYEVEVNGKVLTTRSIIVSTGARPFIPPIPGVNEAAVYTSDNLWELREQPKDLVVLGGGPIGCELAQSFHRLGTKVTIIERSSPNLMAREDDDVSCVVTKKFKAEGINVLTAHQVIEFKNNNGQKEIIVKHNNVTKSIPYTSCLMALGRRANVTGFGMEELGIELRNNGTIEANDFLATNFPNIFVCGDVTGPYQFTHTASHQAYYACINALFHPITKWVPNFITKKFLKVDYSVIPWATYTDPEVATVGYTESSAKLSNVKYEVTTYGMDDLDRAITDGEDHGFVKVLTHPGSDKIVGATIVHARASELITEFILAMRMGAGLNSIMGTIHIYPTLSEANKFLAGNWKKARKPEKILNNLGVFLTWLRN